MGIMQAPASGVTVRMYRLGHGDCFLLAFRKESGEPFYMLIDCGLKKGSEINHDIDSVARHIHDSTGGHLDLVVLSHEHEDHLSGFWDARSVFDNMKIDQLWVAWTELENHPLAKALRRKYRDRVADLAAAAHRLAESDDPADVRTRQKLTGLIGAGGDGGSISAAFGVSVKNMKAGLERIAKKARAKYGTRFLFPHSKPCWLPGVEKVRVFVLGPPQNWELLHSLNPTGKEEFKISDTFDDGASFFAAVRGNEGAAAGQPFADRFRIAEEELSQSEHAGFFARRYGMRGEDHPQRWRRVDCDWLRLAEELAIRMKRATNNSCLTFAIELPATRKVLLFTGDAQRGNWVSWHLKNWTVDGPDGTEEVTAEDLLNRTVFYKVGHHGSHNATLKASGFEMMAKGEYEKDFVAMIPAHSKWAYAIRPNPWRHPMDKIHEAMLEKARGRVFLMDKDQVTRHSDLSNDEWEAFEAMKQENDMYFEYTVQDGDGS